jgi:hypothetical protein
MQSSGPESGSSGHSADDCTHDLTLRSTEDDEEAPAPAVGTLAHFGGRSFHHTSAVTTAATLPALPGVPGMHAPLLPHADPLATTAGGMLPPLEGMPPRAERPWGVLAWLICAVLVYAIVLTVLGVESNSAYWLAVPMHALSLVCCAGLVSFWLSHPELQSTHTGHVVFLSIAQVWFSSTWLIFAISRVCLWRQIATTGWVATWLWTNALAADWLLLLLHKRGTSHARAKLAQWSHLVWPAAIALSMPVLSARTTLVDTGAPATARALRRPRAPPAPPSLRGAGIEPYCEVHVGCQSLLPLASALGASILFAVGCHLAGLALSADAPLVVWRRQRRSALLVCAGLLLLHPPTLAYLYFTDSCTSAGPPRLLALWASFGGASCQGIVALLAYALAEPAFVNVLRAALARTPEPTPALAHADSRHVHFHREQLAVQLTAAAHPHDPVLRALADQRAALTNEPSVKWWWMIPVVAAVGAVITVVMLLHQGM